MPTDPITCFTNFYNAVADATDTLATALENCTTNECKDAAITEYLASVNAAKTAFDQCRANQSGGNGGPDE